MYLFIVEESCYLDKIVFLLDFLAAHTHRINHRFREKSMSEYILYPASCCFKVNPNIEPRSQFD